MRQVEVSSGFQNILYLFLFLHLVLSSDHFGCLTVLMRTPYCKRDAKEVLLEAKHMRDTKVRYSCLYFLYVLRFNKIKVNVDASASF